MHRYRFALRPKWIFGHLIVLSMVIGFVNAGLWQLRRLDQRKSFNAVVSQNYARPVTPIGQVLTAAEGAKAADAALDRRVSATGRYLVDREVVITGQADALDDPGAWLITPLLLHDGTVVLVNRGWISSTGNVSSSPAFARPPTGEVTVVGALTQTQVPGPGESKEPSSGTLASMLRVNVARIQQQVPQRIVPAFVQLISETPSSKAAVVPTPLPPLAVNNGPHLGYAEQWFSFTGLALVAYPILLWKVAGDREQDERGLGDDGDPYGDLPEGAIVDDDGIIDLTGVGASAGRPD